jgi:nitric oxide reductase subunit B
MDIEFNSDRPARALLVLSISYLLLGLLLGLIGGFQYLLPDFLKETLSFQRSRPLHVYLVLSWIFTAAQGGLYYYLPRVSGRPLAWNGGAWIHFTMQLLLSGIITTLFFMGHFGGREYLEFPPLFGLLIMCSWLPLVYNFFATLKPRYQEAPVYIWSWSTGILFFFITYAESYLWLLDYFNGNIVRDTTIQWKALGSMVGSWNMLVYGTGMYIMEKISGDTKTNRSKQAFFFYFLGLTNLMFNWGHHTYIVPAASWVKTVSYVISMTELLILGNIILQWRKTVTEAQKNYHQLSYRLLTYADIWVFLNLVLAIFLSIPAINYYTHGTHFTVAHAMGATIGINTMLLLASVFYIAKMGDKKPHQKREQWIGAMLLILNIALLLFWISLLGAGFQKISDRLHQIVFAEMMIRSQPYFKWLTYSGVFIFLALLGVLTLAIRSMYTRKKVA